MSTTMHAHIEVKKNGKWLHFGAPKGLTDGLVHAVINGVSIDTFNTHGRIHPVCRINSLPEDMTEITKICLEEDRKDYRIHDEGMLEACDIEKLQKELDNFRPEPLSHYDLEHNIFYTYICNGAIAAHRGFDDVRIIFWYDH